MKKKSKKVLATKQNSRNFFATIQYWQSFLLAPSAKAVAYTSRTWHLLPWILAIAFVLRVAIALVGDFVIHPDEIMQYLEPAHGLVFSNHVSYWEYVYGARSWLLPSIIAAVLWSCQLLGLDTPTLYIAAVKILFCAVSLVIPYGMYRVSRHLLDEMTARVALILGAFWYELIAFAHKSMTEFVATSLLLILMILVLRPSPPSLRRACITVLLATFVIAIRFQYIPVVGGIVLLDFLRTDNRIRLTMMGVGLLSIALVGLFDYLTWGNFLHSYWVNLQVNLHLNTGRSGESSPLVFIGWLSLASGGAFLVAVISMVTDYKRRLLWIYLLLLVLLPHILQAHREYRFVFAAIPIWLIVFADFLNYGLLTKRKNDSPKRRLIGATAYLSIVCVLGILNLIPGQAWVYTANSQETGRVNFIRQQDPIFALYRDLAQNSEQVKGVWDSTRPYFNGGGYYYLHHSIPFYDIHSWQRRIPLDDVDGYVSHLITPSPITAQGVVALRSGRNALKSGNNYIPLPSIINDEQLQKPVYWGANGQPIAIDGFVVDKTINELTLWKAADNNRSIRLWESYRVLPDSEAMYPHVKKAMGRYKISTPTDNVGIEFVQ